MTKKLIQSAVSSITMDHPTRPLQRPRHWRRLRNEAADSSGRAPIHKYRNQLSLAALQACLPAGRNRGSDTRLHARYFVSGLSDTAFERENDNTSEPKMNNAQQWCGRFAAAFWIIDE